MAPDATKPDSHRSASQQTADAVMMVRPAAFGYNAETAQTNSFQKSEGPADAARRAVSEFDGCVQALRSEGIAVCVVEDTADPVKPDAVFPNNWISFHADGTVVLYPMQAVSRRLERRREVIDTVAAELGYRVSRIVDLTHHEAAGRFLEGTGSLVLDHVHRIAYACISPRTAPEVVQQWASELQYAPVLFEARDRAGAALYHTNVMLCLGTDFALVASASLPVGDRRRVRDSLLTGGREVIEIGHEELDGFAGNMLELATWDEALGDCRVLVMSATARRALQPESYARLAAATDTVLCVPVPTIETLGGGSVRCMMAEVFRGT